MSSVQLDASDAAELAGMPTFISDWFAGPDSHRLAASLRRFIGVDAYGVGDLRTDLARLTFLLGHDDGEQLFGVTNHDACPLLSLRATNHRRRAADR